MAIMDVGNLLIWQAIKLYLPVGTKLTSVYRPPQAQLNIISRKAKTAGYNFTRPPLLNDRTSWIGALEFLRSHGYKIAEPGKSMHQRGLAYDFSGPDLLKIKAAIKKAIDENRIKLVSKPNNFIIEARNNCVHVEIEEGILDFEPFEFA